MCAFVHMDARVYRVSGVVRLVENPVTTWPYTVVEGEARREYLNYILACPPEPLEAITACVTRRYQQQQWNERGSTRQPENWWGEGRVKTGAGCPAGPQAVTPQALLPVESQWMKKHGVYFFMTTANKVSRLKSWQQRGAVQWFRCVLWHVGQLDS